MERLHKFMAHCGIASRRQAEDYIRQQMVSVNGTVIKEVGVKIDPDNDVVEVNGKVIHPEKKVCYLLHKPKGFATTVEDDLGRRTVMDLISDVEERIYPAGRLDLDSEGLILLTNDGDVAYYLTHPSCGVKKVYEALVEGNVENDTIDSLLQKGVYLGSMKIKPLMVKIVKRQENATLVRIIVAEGVNREVRRLFAALGHEVKRLVRLEIGPFKIDGISRGKYRKATAQEMAELRENMENNAAKENTRPHFKKKKFGVLAPRAGKPDPALYANGTKPRHTPLVLKKKNLRNNGESFDDSSQNRDEFSQQHSKHDDKFSGDFRKNKRNAHPVKDYSNDRYREYDEDDAYFSGNRFEHKRNNRKYARNFDDNQYSKRGNSQARASKYREDNPAVTGFQRPPSRFSRNENNSESRSGRNANNSYGRNKNFDRSGNKTTARGFNKQSGQKKNFGGGLGKKQSKPNFARKNNGRKSSSHPLNRD